MEADPWLCQLPNIRSAIVPDPGMVLVEADLKRADACVVAWDAHCRDLKLALLAGEDIYTEAAHHLYGHNAFTNSRALHVNGMTYYDNGKRAIHLADYAGGARTLAQSTACREDAARHFLHWWCHVHHPAIGEWHERRKRDLASRRTPRITNAFGFVRTYTDRTDHLLGQALAWIAQSTVAVVINHCLLNVHTNLTRQGIQLLLQVHDSLLMQCPQDRMDLFPLILEQMRVEVPYPDPLVIPCELKWSARDWASMEKWTPARAAA